MPSLRDLEFCFGLQKLRRIRTIRNGMNRLFADWTDSSGFEFMPQCGCSVSRVKVFVPLVGGFYFVPSFRRILLSSLDGREH